MDSRNFDAVSGLAAAQIIWDLEKICRISDIEVIQGFEIISRLPSEGLTSQHFHMDQEL